MKELDGKTVLLGITGGISAYKSVELARLLIRAGVEVKVVMTESAGRFVSPLTFRAITRNPVADSMWSDPGSPIPHISLADEADVVVVAPATANIIAKHSHGIADDLLSTLLLAAKGRVIFAPAMNERMYLHPATVENIKTLKERGVIFVAPGEGELACGEVGVGRMAEPPEIFETVKYELLKSDSLKGRKIIVTAGPTREHIDPVRFISNPSTGKMGFIVAQRARMRGADVKLICGPCDLKAAGGVETVRVTTAREMRDAVFEGLTDADALIMAAAVADYRPAGGAAGKKVKKSDKVFELKLEPTEDILSEAGAKKGKCVLVGFAAETENVIENGIEKLKKKNLDLIVANKVDDPASGFGTDASLCAIIPSGETSARNGELKMMSKVEIAEKVLDLVENLLERRT